MTTQASTLIVQPRSVLGKEVKRLRREGVTPIHLYGPGIASMALQVGTPLLIRTLAAIGRSRPVTLEIENGGGQHLAFVRDIQFHGVSGEVQHVDLLRVDVSVVTRVEVPVELRGEAPAVRLRGGALIQGLHSVIVEAMPMDIPETIAIDVSPLHEFDDVLRVSDLSVPANVTVLTDSEQMVAQVAAPVGLAAEEAGAQAAEPDVVAPDRAEDEDADE